MCPQQTLSFLMTTCQTITLDFDEEMKNTRKLLERIPLDDQHRGFKPHPKSAPMDQLATHVAQLPGWMKMALESQEFVLSPDFVFQIAKSTQELLEIFDQSAAEGREWLDRATDEDIQKEWTFKYGDMFSMTSPRTQVVRSFLNHMIHHRAQLSVYLRLNEIPVPGMYGSSADEDWPGAR